ncbi:MAG TPA: hypothetical protein V6C71_12765 [Coleofasciculaceae cyanobacterium]|jgi:Tfp pilus assembly protein PilP
MNKAVLLILTGTLALLTQSCSFFADFADSKKELDENTAKPIPSEINASQQAENQEVEAEFTDLEEEVEPTQEIVNLIPATNPDVRVRSIIRGRNDPFSVVTLNPRIKIEPKEEKPASSPTVPTNTPSQPAQQTNQDNNTNADLPQPKPPVEPTLAQNVVVSGLYQANGRTRLIVQAPEESTSRYVEVGEYLSNGQVLVKRIVQNQLSLPLVILEQSGIEVSKTIGETSEAANGDLSSLPEKTLSNKTWVSSISLN